MKAVWLLLMTLSCGLSAAGELRDPTRPPQAQLPPAQRLPAQASVPVLSALYIRNGEAGSSRKAIVDGRWVRAGDDVGGGRIESISRDGVRWVRRGQAHELRLAGLSPSFKKVTADPPRAGNGVPEHAP